jgi:hypothetical protein
MLSDVVEGILEFLFHVFIEIICFYTGEIILYLLTLGKKKPRWDYYTGASPTKFVIMTEISVWIGFAFWILTIGFIARAIMK